MLAGDLNYGPEPLQISTVHHHLHLQDLQPGTQQQNTFPAFDPEHEVRENGRYEFCNAF